jgi:signal peptidase II
MMDKTTTKKGYYLGYGLGLLAAVMVLDQLTKWLVFETVLRVAGDAPGFFSWLVTQRSLESFYDARADYATVVLAPFLNFVMVWNTGVSFGMFGGGGEWVKVALIAVAFVISGVMLAWLYLASRVLVASALALIVGGALGNVIDRFRFGAVADFVDVHVMGYHWPAFNVADSAIAVGAGILILDALLNKENATVI